MTRTAHCSCGALRIEVSGETDAVVVCRLWRMSAAHRLGVRRRCLLQKRARPDCAVPAPRPTP